MHVHTQKSGKGWVSEHCQAHVLLLVGPGDFFSRKREIQGFSLSNILSALWKSNRHEL